MWKQTRESYEQSESGKETRETYDYRKILSDLEVDTGFNCICCSCNEFKSKNGCLNSLLRGGKESRFTEKGGMLYLVKYEHFNITLDGHFYVFPILF